MANTHLIRVIMTIFVDIEYTGDSMEFEAKFRKCSITLVFSSPLLLPSLSHFSLSLLYSCIPSSLTVSFIHYELWSHLFFPPISLSSLPFLPSLLPLPSSLPSSICPPPPFFHPSLHQSLPPPSYVCTEYRIPMYEVLRFVWELPSYQASVDTLTREAVQYDGTQQEIPIFLRFINMIINDATLQLDEGLEVLLLYSRNFRG